MEDCLRFVNTKIASSTEASTENELYDNRLNLNVTTWMKLYKHLKPSSRVQMRDVSIKIAKAFRKGKVKVCDRGTFASKFNLSKPYHLFLTSVDEIEDTYNQPFSVKLHEIIDYSLGQIINSLHINYMVEILWIVTEYMIARQNPKMTITYNKFLDFGKSLFIPFDIDTVPIIMDPKQTYGSHHSKISILQYRNKCIRILVSTANIYAYDWQCRTQGIWISPLLPLLPDEIEFPAGESVTNFKTDFLNYLSVYDNIEIRRWMPLILKMDFSAINVFFIASVPGHHVDTNLNRWGHRRLGQLLSENCTLPSNEKNWTFVSQCSAVGVYGESFQSWLQPTILQAASREKNKRIIFMPNFKMIYPSENCFDNSLDCKIGASSLIYNKDNHKKQTWIKEYMVLWKADSLNRSIAMPHMKTYTRISPDQKEISWFLLTSANLSKGAWGKMINRGTCQTIANYEAGVLFIPQIMINQNSFPIKESSNPEVPVFLLPYDLPLVPYRINDEPFVLNFNESQNIIEHSKETSETSNLNKSGEEVN